jgi:hypothetical protein
MIRRLPVPQTGPEVIERLRISVAGGASQDDVIAQMRREGLSIIPSIKLLIQFFNLPPNEAKVAVHYSQTWSDCSETNDALHESAFQAAKQLGFEVIESDATEAGSNPSLQEAS